MRFKRSRAQARTSESTIFYGDHHHSILPASVQRATRQARERSCVIGLLLIPVSAMAEADAASRCRCPGGVVNKETCHLTPCRPAPKPVSADVPAAARASGNCEAGRPGAYFLPASWDCR